MTGNPHSLYLVRIGSHSSAVTSCTVGVPQESVLGPLFLVYTFPLNSTKSDAMLNKVCTYRSLGLLLFSVYTSNFSPDNPIPSGPSAAVRRWHTTLCHSVTPYIIVTKSAHSSHARALFMSGSAIMVWHLTPLPHPIWCHSLRYISALKNYAWTPYLDSRGPTSKGTDGEGSGGKRKLKGGTGGRMEGREGKVASWLLGDGRPCCSVSCVTKMALSRQSLKSVLCLLEYCMTLCTRR